MISTSRRSLIAVIAVAALAFVPCYESTRFLIASDMLDGSTLGEHILCFFMGAAPFDISADNRYLQFPVVWIMEISVLLLVNINHMDNIFSCCGYQLVVRSGSRRRCWMAKFLSLFITCTIQLAVLYIAIAILALICGAELTFYVSPEFAEILFPNSNEELMSSISGSGLTLVMLLPALTILAINHIQCLLRLYMKPVISFFISVCILLASLYFFSPLLIGNYAMLARVVPFLSDGMRPWHGIISNIVVILLAYIVGTVRISKMDFI